MADVKLNWNGQELVTFNYGFAAGISKDFTRADDGTVLTEKHTITIKGSFIASGSSANQRYISLLNQAFSNASKVITSASRQKNLQAGTLEFTNTGIPIYQSATLISINIPEPSEDTAGIQFQEVNLTFESYNTPNYDSQLYKLKSASENFEIRKDEDKIFYEGDAIDSDTAFKYGVTITHTVSAQGLFDNGAAKSDALSEAYKYIKTRLKDTPPIANKDILGDNLLGGQSFNSKQWRLSGSVADDRTVISSEIDSYTAYNKIRTSSSDVTTGSYSVTTTYFMTKPGTAPATIDVNANFNRDESGESSVSVEGTIQGLSTKNPEDVTNDKITNARAVYNTLSGGKSLRTGCPIFSLANNTFTNYHPDQSYVAIRDYPMATTLGENKTAGTIAFNVTYKIYPSEFKALLDDIPGVITANISVNDVNRSGAGYDMQTIVVKPIVGRAKGPILQNMNTTKERKRNAVVDVLVDASQRTKENEALKATVMTKVNEYRPTSPTTYIENFTDSWNWTTGKYTATLDWIYQV